MQKNLSSRKNISANPDNLVIFIHLDKMVCLPLTERDALVFWKGHLSPDLGSGQHRRPSHQQYCLKGMGFHQGQSPYFFPTSRGLCLRSALPGRIVFFGAAGCKKKQGYAKNGNSHFYPMLTLS
jgi:hypothetical protein